MVRADVHLGPVEFSFLDDLAVFLDLPVGIEEVAKILVQVAAFDFNFTLGGVNIMDAHLAVLVLDFPKFGLNFTVGEHQAVGAEVVVVLPVAPHAAEFKVGCSLVTKTLVYKVPNEAAKRAGIAVEGVHVFLQVPYAVAHGMFVFAKHNGLVSVVVVLDGVWPKVHPAVHIGIAPVSLVMHIAGGVNLVGSFPFRGENIAVAGLVS